MTLKFNYVKYCLVILGIALLFTGINGVYAFWSWPDSSQWCRNGVFPNCSDYPVSSRSTTFSSAGTDYNDLNVMNYQLSYGSNSCYSNCYFTSQGSFYRLTSDSHTISGNLKTYNDGDFLSWRLNDSVGTAFYGYVAFQYSFINYVKDGVNSVFSWWYDLGKKYNSISVSGLPTLPDINNTGDFFDFVQPRHSSWIFYNRYYDIDLKTVQYIGNQVLYDKFIYVDSLASTDNIWLVDTELNKAWSMTETDINIISDFLFGNIKFTDEVLNNAGRTDYYDVVLNTGGKSFLPLTYGNFAASSYSDQGMRGIKSFKGSNIGITYNKIYDFEGPNYGNSDNGSGSVSSGSYDSQIRSYEQCIADNTPIKELSHLGYKCLEVVNNNPSITDEDFLELFMYIERLDYYIGQNVEYTGYYPNTAISNWCGRWVNYAESIYPNYTTGNYHDLALVAGTYVDTDSYDLEYACGSYPRVSSEQSWACTYLGVGCDGFSFGMGYDQVKSFVKPFWDESVGVLITSFDSGFNYFNIPNCSSDYYGKSYGRANTIFIVFVAFIVFQLYLFFKS